MIAAPQQGLRDYRAVYQQVHAWPALAGTAAEKMRTALRFIGEAEAIEAFASQGKFSQALVWLEQYQPGDNGETTAGEAYSDVIVDMLAKKDFAQVPSAFQQCHEEGDDFPFEGGATALEAEGLLPLQRMAIARAGLEVAGSAADVRPAALFLAQVHRVYPGLDSESEDAILSLLRHAHANAVANPSMAAVDRRGGALLLSILEQIDAQSAEEARAEFPAASQTNPDGAPVIYASPAGKVIGAGSGPEAPAQISELAPSDPDGALADAAKLISEEQRFGALAGIAQALARAHPRRAARAAGEAYGLIDDDIAQADTGYMADLAQAYSLLGAPGRAAEVAGRALDAADAHAAQAEAGYDLSDPDAVARLAGQLLLPAVGLSYPYAEVAEFLPRLALAHARDCNCKVLKPLVLARLAEALTPAGAKAVQ